MNKNFVNKYKSLVSKKVCEENNVDFNDEVARANLAYKLLTGNDAVIMVPTMIPANVCINSHGQFVNGDCTHTYGRITDLITDPVSLAFDIVADHPMPTPISSDTIVIQDAITVQTNNFSWIAKLFAMGHIFYQTIKEEDVPTLWVVCDHSYEDVNHIETIAPIQNSQTLFGFLTGNVYVTHEDSFEKSIHSSSVILLTKYFLESDNGTFTTKDILNAYISEHSLNYHLVTNKGGK